MRFFFSLTSSVKTPLFVLPEVSTKSPLSATMLAGRTLASYREGGCCQSHDAWHLYNITGVTAHGRHDPAGWKEKGSQGSGRILNFSRQEESTGQIILRYASPANGSAIMFEKVSSEWSYCWGDLKGTSQRASHHVTESIKGFGRMFSKMLNSLILRLFLFPYVPWNLLAWTSFFVILYSTINVASHFYKWVQTQLMPVRRRAALSPVFNRSPFKYARESIFDK